MHCVVNWVLCTLGTFEGFHNYIGILRNVGTKLKYNGYWVSLWNIMVVDKLVLRRYYAY